MRRGVASLRKLSLWIGCSAAVLDRILTSWGAINFAQCDHIINTLYRLLFIQHFSCNLLFFELDILFVKQFYSCSAEPHPGNKYQFEQVDAFFFIHIGISHKRWVAVNSVHSFSPINMENILGTWKQLIFALVSNSIVWNSPQATNWKLAKRLIVEKQWQIHTQHF